MFAKCSLKSKYDKESMLDDSSIGFFDFYTWGKKKESNTTSKTKKWEAKQLKKKDQKEEQRKSIEA